MKPLFKLREFAWAIVSEVEDWLYPYRTDDTEPVSYTHLRAHETV